MAYVRPIYNRQSSKGNPDRKPVGYEVRYRAPMAGSGRRAGSAGGGTPMPTQSRSSQAASTGR